MCCDLCISKRLHHTKVIYYDTREFIKLSPMNIKTLNERWINIWLVLLYHLLSCILVCLNFLLCHLLSYILVVSASFWFDLAKNLWLLFCTINVKFFYQFFIIRSTLAMHIVGFSFYHNPCLFKIKRKKYYINVSFTELFLD